MKLKVEIESEFVEHRSGISAKGKPWEMREQKAWFYLGSKFPKEVTLTLENGVVPHKVGMYEADLLPALNVGDFGRLEIDGRRLQLVPLAEKPVASAKAA